MWPLMLIIKGFTYDQHAVVKSLDGLSWNVASLLQSAGLVSIGTLVSIGIVAIVILANSDKFPKRTA